MPCQGYQLSPGNKTAPYGAQNYCCEIFIYSGNAGNTSGASIALYPGSNVSGETDSGCFHYGCASNNTTSNRLNNVYLAQYISDPLKKLTVWVQNTSWWGNPLIEVTTAGSWYQDTSMSSVLATTGFVVLPFNTVSTVRVDFQ